MSRIDVAAPRLKEQRGDRRRACRSSRMQQSANWTVVHRSSRVGRSALARGRLAPAPPSAREQGSRSDHSRKWAPPAGAGCASGESQDWDPSESSSCFVERGESGLASSSLGCTGPPSRSARSAKWAVTSTLSAWRVWRGNLRGLRAKVLAVGAGCGLDMCRNAKLGVAAVVTLASVAVVAGAASGRPRASKALKALKTVRGLYDLRKVKRRRRLWCHSRDS